MMQIYNFLDYHVFAIQEHQESQPTLVYDLSSQLPFPTPLLDYCVNSFLITYLVPQNEKLLAMLQETRFRILSAAEYLQLFSSDRSHMFRDNQWLAPPPEYAPIVQPSNKTGKLMNLHDFKDMSNEFVGTICNLEQFLQHFGMDLQLVLQILTARKL